MKITGIETLQWSAYPRPLVVRVHTDGGIVGLGERLLTWNGGIAETRKIAVLAETFGVPLVLHNVAGPICHAACMHLGAHIPNLFFVESCRAFYKTYFPLLSDLAPAVDNGHLSIPQGPGLGVQLNPEALDRDDLTREITEGPGLAAGRRAMGDHWAVEEIR